MHGFIFILFYYLMYDLILADKSDTDHLSMVKHENILQTLLEQSRSIFSVFILWIHQLSMVTIFLGLRKICITWILDFVVFSNSAYKFIRNLILINTYIVYSWIFYP